MRVWAGIRSNHQLILLNIRLPNPSSFDLCRQLLIEGKPQLIMMLTDLYGSLDKELELELDADDYMVKPYDPRILISDPSNMLGSPITVLKNFNALLHGPAAEDPLVQVEFLTESQAQVEHLEWIASNLPDLSRLEAGLEKLDLTDHDLREALASAKARFKAQAVEKNIALTTLPPAPSLYITL